MFGLGGIETLALGIVAVSGVILVIFLMTRSGGESS
jgi:hypothetical protein